MNSFNLADTFVGLGHRYVNRTALVSRSRSLSFSELAAYGAQLGRALRTRGVGPGQNVGLAFRDGFDTITYMLALWMIDAVPVPFDFRARLDERARLVEDFDLALVCSDAGSIASGFEGQPHDDAWTETVARQSAEPPRSPEPTTETAMISLTSGTTGRPLGLILTHAEMLLRQLTQRDAGLNFPLGIHFNAAPLSFSASRTQTISRLCEGNTVHFFPSMFSPEEFVEALNRSQATFTFVVPTVIRSLVEYARSHPQDGPLFPTLLGMQGGGSMSTPDEKREAKRLLTPHYYEVYASSLAGTFTVLRGEDVDNHADTVGRVIPTVRLEIVDDEDRLLPAGEAGIIRLRTPSMATGTYRNIARATGDRLKDGWIYPGDLGSIDADGYVRILGRTSDVIIRGGANVHPAEVEKILSTHPAVRAVTVLGYASEREGEEIGAVVVGDSNVGEAELTAFVRAQLPPDKRPRRFLLVPALPVTNAGKPDKAAMRKLLEGDGG